MNAVALHTDPDVLREIVAVLGEHQWTVTVAGEPGEALEACRASEADVVLLDATVPGAVADVLDRVKRDPELFRTAIVMLARDPEPGAVLTWLRHGADDVL